MSNETETMDKQTIIDEIKGLLNELFENVKSFEGELEKYERETNASDKLERLMRMKGDVERIELHTAHIDRDFSEFLESAIK